MNSRLHVIQPITLDADTAFKRSPSLNYVPLKLVFMFAPPSFCLHALFLYFTNPKSIP